MKVRFAVSVGLGPPEPVQLAEVVGQVESSGFGTLWMADLPSVASVEPGAGVAFAAALTRTVRLGANFVAFGVEPYLLARRLAQLDRLSGGRLLVTLVPGLDLAPERRALATEGRHRGRMLEQLVGALRGWWSGQAGEGSELRLPVLPVQQPLELWLGGSGPGAVLRAGRVADGWLGSLVSPRRAGEIRLAIDEEAARAGRRIDPEHFGLSIGYARRPGDLEHASLLRARLARLGEGELGELVPMGRAALRALVGRLVEAGLSKFVLRPLAIPASPLAWEEELAWLADAVLDLESPS